MSPPDASVEEGQQQQQQQQQHVRLPLNILIIGGSLGGLMVGFLLKRNGHHVTILEQAHSSEREGLAAGIGFARHVRRFFENDLGISGSVLGVSHRGFEVLDKNLQVQSFVPLEMRMTSWDCAYYQTRAKFDGLRSSYVEHPKMIETEGTGTYETGKKALQVELEDDEMVALVEDTATGRMQRYRGDLIVAVDGANSAIRRQLHPHLAREEPGYLLWRGTVPTGELPLDVREMLENRGLVYPTAYSYAVIYTIPGDHGSLESGKSHINIAWYCWPNKSHPVSEIMTDIDGHRHHSTVPKGKLRPEIWAAQVQASAELLPPTLHELIIRIQQPFVTVISSLSAPEASYFNNRLFLIGDALTQCQPNLGMGTDLAACAAYGLAEAIGTAGAIPANTSHGEKRPILDPERIALWEHSILHTTDLARVQAVAFGSWYLRTWFWIAVYYARWHFKKWWWILKFS